MIRRVEWSRDALDDLKAQAAYIAADNPVAARRVAARIRKIGNSLGTMATGRSGRVYGTYEQPISDLPYTVAYAVRSVPGEGETVTILRVIHGAPDWPADEWPRK